MFNFKTAYINELFKISKKKKITLAMVMCFLVTAVAAVIVCTVGNFMGVNVAGNSEFSLIILPVLINVLIPLFVMFVCIDMFCGEYSVSTIKITLLTPAPRIKIFTAKVLALITFAATMLAFSMLLSFAVAIVIGKTEFAVIKILASYIVTIIPMSCVCLLAVLIANLAKGSGGAFTLSIIIYMAFRVFEVLNPQLSAFAFTSGMNMYVLLSAPLISFAKVLRLLLIETGFGAMLFAIGYALFEQKEF